MKVHLAKVYLSGRYIKIDKDGKTQTCCGVYLIQDWLTELPLLVTCQQCQETFSYIEQGGLNAQVYRSADRSDNSGVVGVVENEGREGPA